MEKERGEVIVTKIEFVKKKIKKRQKKRKKKRKRQRKGKSLMFSMQQLLTQQLIRTSGS